MSVINSETLVGQFLNCECRQGRKWKWKTCVPKEVMPVNPGNIDPVLVKVGDQSGASVPSESLRNPLTRGQGHPTWCPHCLKDVEVFHSAVIYSDSWWDEWSLPHLYHPNEKSIQYPFPTEIILCSVTAMKRCQSAVNFQKSHSGNLYILSI